jgi:uncharacterized protein with HEPN domain
VSSRKSEQRFEDILENIASIAEFTRGMSDASFTADAKTVNAVERCPERISEASRKLGSIAEEMCPEIDWPALRAVGNILRHEYERVEVTRVWLMVEDDLPPLEAAVSGALARMKD